MAANPTASAEIDRVVREALHEALGERLAEVRLTDQTHLADELALSSREVVTLAAEIRERLGLSRAEPSRPVTELVRVGDLKQIATGPASGGDADPLAASLARGAKRRARRRR